MTYNAERTKRAVATIYLTEAGETNGDTSDGREDGERERERERERGRGRERRHPKNFV